MMRLVNVNFGTLNLGVVFTSSGARTLIGNVTCKMWVKGKPRKAARQWGAPEIRTLSPNRSVTP